ncbi:hypothetical protein LRN_1625 [Ligilactobacillus ruminis DPC 6832]|uniref:Uncharacterized protein n=1 Tax=Ligilactobacillus ruminis DPC 6832 TaxID=1402208 RepID=A0A837DS50_9LACO|nr:hypothetical protein LRN_1625 [Ligilactobacillus ruminis DPC 6832]
MRFLVTVAFFLNVISEAQVPMFITKKTVAMSTAFFMKESIGDLFYTFWTDDARMGITISQR